MTGLATINVLKKTMNHVVTFKITAQAPAVVGRNCKVSRAVDTPGLSTAVTALE